MTLRNTDAIGALVHMATLGWRVEVTHHHDVYFVSAITPKPERFDTCHKSADDLPTAIERVYQDWQEEIGLARTD